MKFFTRSKASPHVFTVRTNDVAWVSQSDIIQILSCPSVNSRERYTFSEKLDMAE